MRFLVGSIVDWPGLFKQAYKCLKPGGYIESHEASPCIGSDDNSVSEDSAMGQWGKIFMEGGRKLQRPFSVLEDNVQVESMKEAGFINIEEEEIKVRLASYYLSNTLILIDARCPLADGLKIPSSKKLVSISRLQSYKTSKALSCSSQTYWAGVKKRSTSLPLGTVVRSGQRRSTVTFAARWSGRKSHLATDGSAVICSAMYVAKKMLFLFQMIDPLFSKLLVASSKLSLCNLVAKRLIGSKVR